METNTFGQIPPESKEYQFLQIWRDMGIVVEEISLSCLNYVASAT